MTEESNLSTNKKLCKRCRGRNWLIQCACTKCDKIIPIRDKKGRPKKYVVGHAMVGQQAHNYKGGRFLSRGYWRLYLPYYFSADKAGHVYEHIFFYQEFHKLCMLKWGEVHHIDEKPSEENANRIGNLQGMTTSQHTILHHKGKKYKIKKDMSGRICLLCKSDKTYKNKTTGRINWLVYQDGFVCHRCWDNKIRKKRVKPS